MFLSKIYYRFDAQPCATVKNYWWFLTKNRPPFLYRDAMWTQCVRMLEGHVKRRCLRKNHCVVSPSKKQARQKERRKRLVTSILDADTWTLVPFRRWEVTTENRMNSFPSCPRHTGIEVVEMIFDYLSLRENIGGFSRENTSHPPPSLHATPFPTRSIQNRSLNRWGNATNAPCAENILVAISHHSTTRTHSYACTL